MIDQFLHLKTKVNFLRNGLSTFFFRRNYCFMCHVLKATHFQLIQYVHSKKIGFQGLSHEISRVLFSLARQTKRGEENLIMFKQISRGSSTFVLNYSSLTGLMSEIFIHTLVMWTIQKVDGGGIQHFIYFWIFKVYRRFPWIGCSPCLLLSNYEKKISKNVVRQSLKCTS